MRFLEGGLESIAKSQVRYSKLMVIATVVITLIMLSPISNVRLEGDFAKQMPQGLKAYTDQDKLISKFGGTDTIMVIMYLDPDVSHSGSVKDIRDPKVINALMDLDSLLRDEASINDISSPTLLFRQTGVPDTLEGVKQLLNSVPEVSGFFSDDYTAVIIFLSADVGTSPEKIDSITVSLSDAISKVTTPTGTKISTTGTPQVIAVIMDMLEQDALYTILVALFFITLFLLIIFKGRGALTTLPIILAVSWMYGTMAWLDIPLSVATAGVGAMILGLSVEYNVFFVERFQEEYEKLKSYNKALVSTLPKVGIGIVGASLTTITGFLALLLSLMPMLQNLGLTLALGIFYSVIVNLVFFPPIILEIGEIKKYFRERKLERSKQRLAEAGYECDDNNLIANGSGKKK